MPLLELNDLDATLQGSKVYSSSDCMSGYHHIAFSDEAQKKLAFVTPIGKFKFKKFPFGLVHVPSPLQQFINEVLKGLQLAFGCIDDRYIFIFSSTAEHSKHL